MGAHHPHQINVKNWRKTQVFIGIQLTVPKWLSFNSLFKVYSMRVTLMRKVIILMEIKVVLNIIMLLVYYYCFVFHF